MSARVTKFSFGPRSLDTKDTYFKEDTVDIHDKDDPNRLEKLGIGRDKPDARIIYLLELATGSRRLLRHQSLGSVSDEGPSPSPDESLFEEEVINKLAQRFKDDLKVPQALFEDHGDRGPKFRFSEDFTFPSAPTTLRADESFALRYYELVSYIGEPSTLSSLSELDDVGLTCTSTGRQIQCHQWQGCRRKEGTLLIVEHKCSFWVRKNNENGYTGKKTSLSPSCLY